MNIDVTEIIALFAQLAGPAFSVAFVFGFGARADARRIRCE